MYQHLLEHQLTTTWEQTQTFLLKNVTFVSSFTQSVVANLMQIN